MAGGREPGGPGPDPLSYGWGATVGATAYTPQGGPIGPQIGQLGLLRPQIRTPRLFLINSAPKSAKSDGNPTISGDFLV